MYKIVGDLSYVFDAEMGKILSDSGIVWWCSARVCVIMVAVGTM